MNTTTYNTRQMSFSDILTKAKIRYDQILYVLSNKEMTAKQIAVELYELGLIPSTERNYTAPRLNELEKTGAVAIVGRCKCQYTGKTVALYRALNKVKR